MSKGWAGGSTRAWRKVRLLVLERDHYKCQMQIPGICKYTADCVHHILGKKYGDNPKHLISACTPCNLHTGEPGSSSRSSSDPKHVAHTQW